MTYSPVRIIRALGAAPTRQTAVWWKLTPGVIEWLRTSQQFDSFLGELVAKAESDGPVYIGTTGDGSRIFFVEKSRHGSYSVPGVKYIPPASADARPLAYEHVRAVFAAAPTTDPSTKPSQGPGLDASRSSTALYVGLGIAGAALLAGGAYLATRKKAPAALSANRRRRGRRLTRNARDLEFVTRQMESGGNFLYWVGWRDRLAGYTPMWDLAAPHQNVFEYGQGYSGSETFQQSPDVDRPIRRNSSATESGEPEIGKRVRLTGDPSRVGVLTGLVKQQQARRFFGVKFQSQNMTVPEGQLEAAPLRAAQVQSNMRRRTSLARTRQ